MDYINNFTLHIKVKVKVKLSLCLTKLGGPQSRSGRGGEGKNSQPLPGIELRSSSP